MKNRKAAAEDGPTAEFLKEPPPNWITELSQILDEIFYKGQEGRGWEIAGVFPIQKAGDEG